MMRYWLSFDLGLRGDYESLYTWLDSRGAKECGTNMATFRSESTRDQLTRELRKVVDLKRNPRLYIINMREGGRWVAGKRTVAPWTGYGQLGTEPGDERDE